MVPGFTKTSHGAVGLHRHGPDNLLAKCLCRYVESGIGSDPQSRLPSPYVHSKLVNQLRMMWSIGQVCNLQQVKDVVNLCRSPRSAADSYVHVSSFPARSLNTPGTGGHVRSMIVSCQVRKRHGSGIFLASSDTYDILKARDAANLTTDRLQIDPGPFHRHFKTLDQLDSWC
jgi:hypothetical protein